MPVHREGRSGQNEDDSPSLKTLNITWNVAFSASSPGQMLLAEVIGDSPASLYGATSTPYEKAQAQLRAQHIRSCLLCLNHFPALADTRIGRLATWPQILRQGSYWPESPHPSYIVRSSSSPVNHV